MMENIRNVAMRIKELREIAGVSLETLAHEFSVSRERYLEYESGETDIPVSFLFKVAHRFSVELTDLLTGSALTGDSGIHTSIWPITSCTRRRNPSL
jgi:transcriptional regulator with XRE-family HTH domain